MCRASARTCDAEMAVAQESHFIGGRLVHTVFVEIHHEIVAGGVRFVNNAWNAHTSSLYWFMDYRNADGSLAEMCGNGTRAITLFAQAFSRTATTCGLPMSTNVPRAEPDVPGMVTS